MIRKIYIKAEERRFDSQTLSRCLFWTSKTCVMHESIIYVDIFKYKCNNTQSINQSSINIYIYKSRFLTCKSRRFCQVAHCMIFFSFGLSSYLNLAFISFKFSIYIKILIKYIYKSRFLMCKSKRFCQMAHCIIFFPFGLPSYLNLAYISKY